MSSSNKNADLKLIQTLEDHTDVVLGLAWRPETGKGAIPPTLATCSADKTVRIWQQSSTGYFECKAVLDNPHTEAVRSCAWSHCGLLFATAFGNTTVIWECNNIWKCNKDNFKLVSRLQGHDKEVINYVSWTWSLGTGLGTCSRDKFVRVWEKKGPSESDDYECEVIEYPEEVETFQWHPIMFAVFSCHSDNAVRVHWYEIDDDEGNDWHHKETLKEADKGHSDTILALSFNSEGNRMVTASADLTLKVWGANIKSWLTGEDYKYWKHRYTLKRYHDQPIYSVHWSCDGIIASGAADNDVCLFVSNDDEETEEIDYDEESEDDEDSEETEVDEDGEETEVDEDGEETEVDEDIKDTADSMEKVPRYKLLLKKKNAHHKAIKSVQWSSGDPDRTFLATASEDKTVKIWKFGFQ